MLVVISVFIPALFMVGIGRALFPPLALAVAFSMIASYLLSSTLVPVLAVWLFRGREQTMHQPRRLFVKLQDGYSRFAGWIVRWRWPAAGVYLAATIPLLVLVPGRLGTELFPRTDTGQFQIRVRAPAGTRIERTEEIVRDIDHAIRDEVGAGGVQLTLANIGNTPWSYPVNAIFTWNAGPQEALLIVALDPKAHTRIAALEDRLRARLATAMPDVHVSFEAGDIVSQVLNFGAPTPINVSVSGANLGETRAFAEQIRVALAANNSLRDVQIAQALDYPTLDVTIDRERAAQLGVGVDKVGRSVVGATSSSVLVVPNFWTNPATGVPYRVAVRVPENQMASAEDLLNLPVMPEGAAGPLLRDVATVTPGTTPGELDHYNSQRTVNIVANLANNDLGGAAAGVEHAIASAGTPPRGTTVAIHGQVEQMRLTLRSLEEGLALAVLVIVLLLTANFQSVRDALVVLAMVPAVLAGVTVVLAATGSTFNVQSLMGAVMSVGVSIANALLMLTFARDRRRDGDTVATAAVAAARGRMRPIVMTSLAMIAGMMPVALGIGEGGEQNAPLGLAVIGGLAASTIAALIFLPAIYSIVARKGAFRSPSLDPDDPDSPTERSTHVDAAAAALPAGSV
jgi:multidrug efflux pump subunit AcrB